MIALCPNCHEVIHFGLAEIRGRGVQALQQLIRVNDIRVPEEAIDLIKAAQREWDERSSHPWEVDVSWLDNDNISLKKDM